MIKKQKKEKTLFEKQIKMLFPSHTIPKKSTRTISQADFTEKCELLSCQMASIFIFQSNILDLYDDFLKILNEMISMISDDIYYPYNIFSSNSIPRSLTILIKTFPNSEVYYKSFKMSEILSKDQSCAIQFCSTSDFIPLVLQCLSIMVHDFNNNNLSIILTLLSILSNIFNNTDNGMIKYCSSMNKLLFELINQVQNEIIIENALLVISNTLKYHQYHSLQDLLEVASFFISNINYAVQPAYSRILYILHQIIDISKESIHIIMNQSTIQLFLQFVLNSSLNTKIATVLVFISLLKKSDDQYKEIIYQELTCSWFKNIWDISQPEMRGSLSELFYYLIYYNRSYLQQAMDNKIVPMILSSMNESSFSLRAVIFQNIIQITLALGNVDFTLFLINNNFLSTIDEFISINDVDVMPFVVRFYYYLFQLMEKKQITIDSFDFENLHEQLSNINVFDIDISNKIKIILKSIESIEEN